MCLSARTKILYLSLILVTFSTTGCAALVIGGAAAAAGAAGYAYYRGNMTGDFPADLETTWAATNAAMTDLGLPVRIINKGTVDAALESSTASGQRIYVQLRPSPSKANPTEPRTEVGVRVGIMGDHAVSRMILTQIDKRLAQQLVPANPPPQLGGAPIGGNIQPAQHVVPGNKTAEPPLAQPAPTQSTSPPTDRPAVEKQG